MVLAPHVGHFYTMVLADTFKRWQLLLGNTDAQFLTGTDEHGIKVGYARGELGMIIKKMFLTTVLDRSKERRKRPGWIRNRFAT